MRKYRGKKKGAAGELPFFKYHALGNDYIVLDPEDIGDIPTSEQIKRICHRNYGIGADGILYGPEGGGEYDFAIRIFNPDGSEAEKSGNGLRIFSRYLYDKGAVSEAPFTVLTAGGPATARITASGKSVSVQMGTVSFESTKIPVNGPPREVLKEKLELGNEQLTFCAATIGNPHCVILRDDLSSELACRLGPLIETHPLFPNRTNVQFVNVLDRSNVRIEIWERGAGYTLSSGSSSSAAAAVVHRLGLCDDRIRVHMPGGEIQIEISPGYEIKMAGPVTRICRGFIYGELLGDSKI